MNFIAQVEENLRDLGSEARKVSHAEFEVIQCIPFEHNLNDFFIVDSTPCSLYLTN